tara:strand:+ start:11846 stop:12844 length:999 start_codon:yes stop_codon:yes gene_type:complete
LKKILILGSSSFAGASMTNFLLSKNFKIYGTYRREKNKQYLPYLRNKKLKNFVNYKVDFNKRPKVLLNIIKKVKPYIILDFASICVVNQSWQYPETYINTNILYKSFIFKNLKNYKFLKKYIYISTPEIFGSSSKLISENSAKFNPSTPYATSKLSAELLLKNYVKNFKLPVVIARFSNFFGPGQPTYRLIPKVIACIDQKIKFPLEGSGVTKRNYIYAYDFCNGIYKIITKGKNGKVYHFSGTKYYKTIDVIKMICKLKKCNWKKIIKKTKMRIGQDYEYKLDSNKTKKNLKWKPLYSLNEALKEIINYNKITKTKFLYKDLIYRDTNFNS